MQKIYSAAELKGLNLIEISGGGCAGCEELMPSVRAVAEKLGLPFLRIDCGEAGTLLSEWGIEKIPATVLCDGGKSVCVCYGYQPEEILELYLEAKLGEYKKEGNYAV